MFIQLSRQEEQPLYLQVAEQMRKKIEQGELPPNTRLPASRVLAKQLGVNRITVVNAYAELEAEGLVVSRVGSGTFVAAEPEEESPPIPDDLEPSRLWQGSLGPQRPWNASQMLTEMMRLVHQPSVISFAAGAPADEFLPVQEFRRALNNVLRRDGAKSLQYEEAAGYPPLRAAIAEYLQARDMEVRNYDVLVTAGCQQALGIALRMLDQNGGGTMLVEDPCYIGLLDLITSRYLTPVSIPLDEYGLQVDNLEQLILRHRPRLIYVTPTYHNPTGVLMPLERRKALLKIANRYGVPILEDATYDELRYKGDPLPTLKSLDTADIVFHAGGFSKTLVPGIRIGYLVAPASIRERLIAAKQTADILTSPLNQRALHAYLQEEHFETHLQRVRSAYEKRRDIMETAARKHFPIEADWLSPQGGMYLWIQMPPDGPTATDLYMMAINYNVAFAIGSVFSASGSFSHAFRLNFANQAEEDIKEGIRRLGKAWQELLERHPQNRTRPDRRSTVHIL